jgi:hypothetical protein
VIWVACWFIPEVLFNIFLDFAPWASGIYLILQLISLIDLFHTLNERFVTDDNIKLVLFVTVCLTLAGLSGFVFSYFKFDDLLSEAVYIISINLGLSVFTFIASILIEHGSILTSSLVTLYTSYLTFSGLMAATNTSTDSTAQVAIFLVFSALLMLCWLVFSATTLSVRLNDGTCCAGENAEPMFSLSTFHHIFALGSVFLTMLVSHWLQQADNDANWAKNAAPFSKWINFAAAWLSQLFYGWTLFAPLICTDRDFT